MVSLCLPNSQIATSPHRFPLWHSVAHRVEQNPSKVVNQQSKVSVALSFTVLAKTFHSRRRIERAGQPFKVPIRLHPYSSVVSLCPPGSQIATSLHRMLCSPRWLCVLNPAVACARGLSPRGCAHPPPSLQRPRPALLCSALLCSALTSSFLRALRERRVNPKSLRVSGNFPKYCEFNMSVGSFEVPCLDEKRGTSHVSPAGPWPQPFPRNCNRAARTRQPNDSD